MKRFIRISIIAALLIVASTVVISLTGCGSNTLKNELDKIEIDYKGQHKHKLTSDIGLPTSLENNDIEVEWSSDSEAITISSDVGVVERLEEDTKVTLTVTLKLKKRIASKDFSVTVRAYEKYQVTFVNADGEVLKTDTVKKGESATAPSNPTLIGHDFVSWDKDYSNIESNLTITALYNKHSFEIVFISNDIEISNEEYEYNETIKAPSSVDVAEGMVFLGWFNKDTNEELSYGEKAISNITYVASFASRTYEVSLEDDIYDALSLSYIDNIVLVNDITLTKDLNISRDINIYTNEYGINLNEHLISFNHTNYRANYIIKGLFTNGTIIIDNINGHFEVTGLPGTNVKVIVENSRSSSVVISGEFDEIEINDTNGNTTIDHDADINKVTAGAGTNVNISESANVGEMDIDPDANLVIDEFREYEIVFLSYDDRVLDSFTIKHGRDAIAPKVDDRTGYTFMGWDHELTNITADTVFMPVYEINSYTVTYYINDVEYKVVSYEYKSDTSFIEYEVEEGYEFSGWQGRLPSKMPANDIEIHATLTIITFEITFVSDVLEVIIVDYGTMPNPTIPTKEANERYSYSFTSWDKEINEAFEDATYIALFEETLNEYTLIWNLESGVVIDTYHYFDEIEMKDEPVKEGYTFTGWSIDIPKYMPAYNLDVYPEFVKTVPGYTKEVISGRDYRLYIPENYDLNKTYNLVVMLHACEQDASDIQGITNWDNLADENDLIILYPDQYSGANTYNCWNWFFKDNHGRDSETKHIYNQIVDVKDEYNINFVFGAGFSAGAAMLSNLTVNYPEVFDGAMYVAGLHYKAAEITNAGIWTNAQPAYDAMDYGTSYSAEDIADMVLGAMAHNKRAIPTIIFHGTNDDIVNIKNSHQLRDSWMILNEVEFAFANTNFDNIGNYSYEHSVYTNSSGVSLLEYYELDGFSHAYPGGNGAFDYSDPNTIEASLLALNFWLNANNEVVAKKGLFEVEILNEDDEIIETIKVKDGELLELADPVREGFEFVGWFSGEYLFDINSPIRRDLQLKAMWIEDENYREEFEIFFVDELGMPLDYMIALEGHPILEIDEVLKPGFIFLGWFLDDKFYDFRNPITSSITLVAKYKKVDVRGEYVEGYKAGRDYVLYLPMNYNEEETYDLVVALHGCDESPYMLAEITRWNQLADEEGFIVLYPTQSYSFLADPRGHPYKCWNFFYTINQERGGENKIIVDQVEYIKDIHNIDYVFATGFSSGAATVANLTSAYPETFDGASYIAGMGYKVASIPTIHWAQEAIDAMNPGTNKTGIEIASDIVKVRNGNDKVIPSVVFHGADDQTVLHLNSRQLTDSLKVFYNALLVETVEDRVDGGLRYTKEIYKDKDDNNVIEYYLVHEMGHGYPGGTPGMGFSDPLGPDATSLSWHYWMEHVKGISYEEEIIEYTVTFDSNGGSDVQSLVVVEGETILDYIIPTKQDHLFVGWFNGDDEFNFSTPITEDLTLVAMWEEEDTSIDHFHEIFTLYEDVLNHYYEYDDLFDMLSFYNDSNIRRYDVKLEFSSVNGILRFKDDRYTLSALKETLADKLLINVVINGLSKSNLDYNINYLDIFFNIMEYIPSNYEASSRYDEDISHLVSLEAKNNGFLALAEELDDNVIHLVGTHYKNDLGIMVEIEQGAVLSSYGDNTVYRRVYRMLDETYTHNEAFSTSTIIFGENHAGLNNNQFPKTGFGYDTVTKDYNGLSINLIRRRSDTNGDKYKYYIWNSNNANTYSINGYGNYVADMSYGLRYIGINPKYINDLTYIINPYKN